MHPLSLTISTHPVYTHTISPNSADICHQPRLVNFTSTRSWRLCGIAPVISSTCSHNIGETSLMSMVIVVGTESLMCGFDNCEFSKKILLNFNIILPSTPRLFEVNSPWPHHQSTVCVCLPHMPHIPPISFFSI